MLRHLHRLRKNFFFYICDVITSPEKEKSSANHYCGEGAGRERCCGVEWQRQKLLLIGNVKEGGGHLAGLRQAGKGGERMERDLEEDC